MTARTGSHADKLPSECVFGVNIMFVLYVN